MLNTENLYRESKISLKNIPHYVQRLAEATLNSVGFINSSRNWLGILILRFFDVSFVPQIVFYQENKIQAYDKLAFVSLRKKVCKKSVNCDKIELIPQEADFLWQEEKENQ